MIWGVGEEDSTVDAGKGDGLAMVEVAAGVSSGRGAVAVAPGDGVAGSDEGPEQAVEINITKTIITIFN